MSDLLNSLRTIYNNPTLNTDQKLCAIGLLINTKDHVNDCHMIVDRLSHADCVVQSYITVGETLVHPWPRDDPGITGWSEKIVATAEIQKDYIKHIRSWIENTYYDNCKGFSPIRVVRPSRHYYEPDTLGLIESMLKDYFNECNVKWVFTE